MLLTARRFMCGAALALTTITVGGIAHAKAAPAKARPAKTAPAQPSLIEQALAQDVITTPSGLQYKILAAGEGARPGDTDYVLINYKGMLTDGKVFDQADMTPMPLNGVIPGFAEGLKLMSPGAKYRLWIPPALAYGDKAQGDVIPANAALVFDIELLDFRTVEQLMQMQAQDQARQTETPAPVETPKGPGKR